MFGNTKVILMKAFEGILKFCFVFQLGSKPKGKVRIRLTLIEKDKFTHTS